MIRSICPKGLLSFGHSTTPLELGELNVLVGPNAAGKSNLLDVLKLVSGIPVDLQGAVRQHGGLRGWLRDDAFSRGPTLDLLVELTGMEMHHRLEFQVVNSELWPVTEVIIHGPDTLMYGASQDAETVKVRVMPALRDEDEDARDRPPLKPGPGLAWARVPIDEALAGALEERPLPPDRAQSILQQVQSPFDYPHLALLASVYRSIGVYDHWPFGRSADFRRSQPADLRGDQLDEGYENIAMVLNQVGQYPEAKQHILDGLRELYEGFVDYNVVVNSGSAQIYFTEKGNRSVPATRLSDGTMRYLCLLVMLYNPGAPQTLCIEEPELGLHPDIVGAFAGHLRAASEHRQIVVTTHSDILVDALSDRPECVVVAEPDERGTQMRRLGSDELREWLKRYSLGELWTRGELGGNRW